MADADPDRGDPPRVLVDDRQSTVVDVAGLVGLAREVLVAEDMTATELSLSFVEPEEIAELHERYLHEAGPTDVLSFPLDESDVDEDGIRLLGDVVIAPAVAARDHPDDPVGELRLLVVHGILHLLGHGHHGEEERAEMWARQERYSGVAVREEAG